MILNTYYMVKRKVAGLKIYIKQPDEDKGMHKQ